MQKCPEYTLKWGAEQKCFELSYMKIGHFKKGRTLKYKQEIYNNEIKKEILDDEYSINIEDINNSIECFATGYQENIAIATAFLEYDIYYLHEKNFNTKNIVYKKIKLQSGEWVLQSKD